MSDKVQKIAAHGFIKRNGKYLVTRRSLLNDYMPGKWDFPGGTIRFGENPVSGLKREVFEETGLKIKVGKPNHIYSFISNPQRHQFQIVYECRYISGEVKLNPKEHDKFIWAKVSDINRLSTIAFLDDFFVKILKKS